MVSCGLFVFINTINWYREGIIILKCLLHIATTIKLISIQAILLSVLLQWANKYPLIFSNSTVDFAIEAQGAENAERYWAKAPEVVVQ